MWFEIRYLSISLVMLWIYWQYAVTYLLMNNFYKSTMIIWLPLGVVFALQNIVFNLTFGSYLFWEKPQQWFFSDRIRSAPEARQRRFKKLLNGPDPDHI